MDARMLGSARRLARIEGLLARPFADREAVGHLVGLQPGELDGLRAAVLPALAEPAAGRLRIAFQDAFEAGRTGEIRGGSPADAAVLTVPSPGVAGDPGAAVAAPVAVSPSPSAIPVVRPTYMLDTEDASPDQTELLMGAPPEARLPFAPGDGLAFAAGVGRPSSVGDDPTRGTDVEETLLLVAPVQTAAATPFELGVEHSLEALVELLVLTLEQPDSALTIAQRFGLRDDADRERVIALWRERWKQDPALQAEWRRLYDKRRHAK